MNADSNPITKWVVADIEGEILSLMQGDVESEDYLEHIRVPDSDLLMKIRHCFHEEEETVLVELDDTRAFVVRAYRQDLTPLT